MKTFINIFFFFSSRRRHTRLQGDWSSDVCSSDLPPTARPTTSAASSTSTNSQRRSFPYENRRRTHQRDPIPRLHLGRGSVPLHRCYAFRVFCTSPVHRVHWSQLGQKVAALYGETRKPRPRDMARVSGCWRRLSSLFQDALPPD